MRATTAMLPCCEKCGSAGSIVEMGLCCLVKRMEAEDRAADQVRRDELQAARETKYRAV